MVVTPDAGNAETSALVWRLLTTGDNYADIFEIFRAFEQTDRAYDLLVRATPWGTYGVESPRG